MNKISLARNLQLIIPDIDKIGSLSGWGLHALNTGHWRNPLATLNHPSNTTPDGPPNTPDVNTDVPPYSNTESPPLHDLLHHLTRRETVGHQTDRTDPFLRHRAHLASLEKSSPHYYYYSPSK